MMLPKKYLKFLIAIIFFFIIIDIALFFSLNRSNNVSNSGKSLDSLNRTNEKIKDGILSGVNNLNYEKKKSNPVYLYENSNDTLKGSSILSIPFSERGITLNVSLNYILYSREYLDTLKYVNYTIGNEIFKMEFDEIKIPDINKKLNFIIKKRYPNVPISISVNKLELKK